MGVKLLEWTEAIKPFKDTAVGFRDVHVIYKLFSMPRCHMWGQRFLNSIICIDYPHSLAHVAWEALTMTVLCAQMASLGLQPVTSVGTQLLALGLLQRRGGRWEGEGEGEG